MRVRFVVGIRSLKRVNAVSANSKRNQKPGIAMESYLDENESEQDDSERTEIRSKLSKMSFEDLLKLKEKLGKKVYKEAMYGDNSKQTNFKRKNKNRPREVSSKVKPVEKKKVKEKRICDPRFDRLCGSFNEKHFQNTYGFLKDIRNKEKEKLKRILNTEKDSERAEKIKYLLRRMENQEQEEAKRLRIEEINKKEREQQIEALKSGKKPHFKTRYEKKIVQLVDKYSSLKKTGKVEKYIKKKQIKQNIKQKHKRNFEVNISDEE